MATDRLVLLPIHLLTLERAVSSHPASATLLRTRRLVTPVLAERAAALAQRYPPREKVPLGYLHRRRDRGPVLQGE